MRKELIPSLFGDLDDLSFSFVGVGGGGTDVRWRGDDGLSC